MIGMPLFEQCMLANGRLLDAIDAAHAAATIAYGSDGSTWSCDSDGWSTWSWNGRSRWSRWSWEQAASAAGSSTWQWSSHPWAADVAAAGSSTTWSRSHPWRQVAVSAAMQENREPSSGSSSTNMSKNDYIEYLKLSSEEHGVVVSAATQAGTCSCPGRGMFCLRIVFRSWRRETPSQLTTWATVDAQEARQMETRLSVLLAHPVHHTPRICRSLQVFGVQLAIERHMTMSRRIEELAIFRP